MNDERQLAVRPNKSQIKRDLAARGALLDRMSGLSDAELRKLEVSERVIELLGQLRAIKPSGARNRQLKYCIKHTADADLSTVELYLNDRNSQQLAVNQALHHLERWRDRLLEQGDAALGDAMAQWPGLDRQQTRQMIRDAQREQETGKPAGAKRKLFRYLRDLNSQS